jgi:hypothetical protein
MVLMHTVNCHSVVFIDANVDDYQSLVLGAVPKAEVIVLDKNSDGVAQMTAALVGRTDISTIHIVSHGAPGCLYLGNTQLSLDTIYSYSSQLKTWGSACIQLYGCNVAVGDAGAEFLTRLHELTGVSIAASSERVGNAEMGGSWQLQQCIGECHVTHAFTAELMQTYSGVFTVKFSETDYSVSLFVDSVTTVDFNGDGKPDLAAPFASSNPANSSKIAVLLNNGSGGFGTPSYFLVGTDLYSSFLTTGDFNGDGKPDFVTANDKSNNVSVLLNNGSGGFYPATNYTVGTRAIFIATGDFNGDGKPDLAVVNQDSNNVSVLLNNGSGSFSSATNYTVGTRPNSIITGDFNGDSKLDLAVANGSSNNVSVLLNNGSGGFGATTNFAAEITDPSSITTGDFNSDGKADLAVASSYSQSSNSKSVSVLLNNGSGNFDTANQFAAVGHPYTFSPLTTGDFNGDGKADLALGDHSRYIGNISVLLNNGSGDFGTINSIVLFRNPYFMTTGDFNSDGKTDLVTTNVLPGDISVLLNTSNTTTASSVTTLLANNINFHDKSLSIATLGNVTNGTITLAVTTLVIFTILWRRFQR